MTARTATDFLGALKRSNLLAPQKLTRIERAAANAGLHDRPDLIARGLREAGLLTAWQAAQLLHGRRAFFLGPYKLLSRIGAGGMGTVFKAERASDGRLVALKVVPQERLSAPGAAARFRREMQAAVRLRHRHIVRAYQAQRIGDFHFLVMEFIDGADLSWYSKKAGRLPIAWSCECIRQAAVGLQFAHEKGLVHRDVKPANLIVAIEKETGRPWVKVVDFGLARFTAESTGDGELTGSGQILGTPDYIAPEQARRTRTADVRADVYSLGCSLFRLISGRLAFEGETPIERLLARYSQDAPLLRTLRDETPAGLEAVVARMLAREPCDRFATPGEAASALQPFAMEPAEEVAPGRSSLSLASTFPLVPPPDFDDELRGRRGSSPEPGAADHAAYDAGEAADDRTRTIPFLELLAEVHEETQPNDGPTRPSRDAQRFSFDELNAPEPAAPRGRSLDWLLPTVFGALVLMVLAIWLTSELWPGPSGSARSTYDDRASSKANVGPAARSIDPESSADPRPTPEPDHAPPEMPSPTPEAPLAEGPRSSERDRLSSLQRVLSKALPYYPQSRVREAVQAIQQQAAAENWTAPDWQRLQRELSITFGASLPPELRRAAFNPPPTAVFGDLRFTHGAEIHVTRFSPDGARLATADRTGLVRLWNVATGELMREFDAAPNVYELTFNASGEKLGALGYTDVWDDALEVWDLTTGARLFAHEGGDAAPLGATFDPRDEDKLWYGDAQGRLVARHVRTGRVLSTTQAHSRLLACLTFITRPDSPDLLLATAGADGLKLWQTVPDVQPVRTLQTFTGDALLFNRWALAADSAGDRLAFLGPDQTLWLTSLRSDAPDQEIPLRGREAQDVAFSSDGSQLLIWGRRAGTLLGWSIPQAQFFVPAGARAEDGAAVAVCDARRTIALTQGGRARMIDSTTGDEISPPLACRGRVLALAAPAMGGVVAADDEGRVCRWSRPTAPPVARRFAGGRIAAAALSTDGSRLLFTSSEGRLSAVDLFADGTPRLLAENVAPHDPLALSDDGRYAAWIDRRSDATLWVVVAETVGGQRGAFPLDGPTSRLGFVAVDGDPSWVAAAIVGRSPAPGSDDGAGRDSQLILGSRSGETRPMTFSNAPRLALTAESGERTLLAHGRSRIALWNVADDQRILDRDLGEPTIASSFDPRSNDRFVVALANARLLALDAAAGSTSKIDLSPASPVATFRLPKMVVEPTSGDVLIADDNGVIFRFAWPQ